MLFFYGECSYIHINIMEILVTIFIPLIKSKTISYSRLFFVGGREGHMPQMMSFVSVDNYTPMPAVLFMVSK